SLARALSDRLGLRLFNLSLPKAAARGAELSEALRILERESILSGFGIYLECTGIDEAVQYSSKTFINSVLERLGVPVILGSLERWEAERKMLTLRVERPVAAVQSELWELALGRAHHALNGGINSLVHQFDFGPTAIVEVVDRAVDEVSLNSEQAQIAMGDLWRTC